MLLSPRRRVTMMTALLVLARWSSIRSCWKLAGAFDESKISSLVQAGALLKKLCVVFGFYPLHEAAERGDERMAKLYRRAPPSTRRRGRATSRG